MSTSRWTTALWCLPLAAILLAGCRAPKRSTACVPRDVRPGPVAVKVKAPPVQPAVAVPAGLESWNLRRVLESKRIKGLVWEEVSLDTAVTYLRTITGVTFHISPKVREEKFEEILINLHVDDVTVLTVLNIITEPYAIRWEERDGVVWLLTSEEIDGPTRLRYYDVRDLIDPDREGAFVSTSHLEREVRVDIFPKYWDREEAVLEVKNNVLIARASQGVHAALDTYLSSARGALGAATLDDAVKQRLDAIKVSLSVSNQTLGEVLKILQIQTGVSLMIDPRIAQEVKDNPITGFKLEDVSLLTALQMLKAAAGESIVLTNRGKVVVLAHREHVHGRPQ